MKIRNNRPLALVISALVLCGSTLFGVGRSVSSAAEKVSDGFFDGVYSEDDGYMQSSIYSQLEMRANAANGILSLCRDAGEEALVSDFRDARAQLVSALEDCDSPENAGNIPDLYTANEELQAAYDALMPALSGSGVLDQAAMKTYINNFTGAQGVIDASAYNDTVEAFFDDVYNHFPVNEISSILDLDIPYSFD